MKLLIDALFFFLFVAFSTPMGYSQTFFRRPIDVDRKVQFFMLNKNLCGFIIANQERT